MTKQDNIKRERQTVIKKLCNCCCYFWLTTECEYPGNKANVVIAECPYFKEIKSIESEV